MAAEKRKREASDASTKSSSKRSRTDEKPKSSKPKREHGKDKEEPKSDRKPPAIKSVLVKEQPAFPRGGAGLLTPIERKQIHARAVRDAAAEQDQPRGLFDVDDGSRDAAEDRFPQPDGTTVRQPKKKKRKYEDSKDDNKARATKVGGLSYKRIAVGSLILGQVAAISSRDLTLALPNNLVGYVPLTSISKQLSSKIETLLDDDKSNKGDEGDDEDIQLADYFHVGHYLRAVVTSTGHDSDTSTSKSRKRLELSIEPGSVNVGLNKSSLVIGAMLQASVASIEDHGFVADLNLENEKIRGFVPSSSLPQSMPLNNVKEGSVMLAQVTHIGSNGKVIKLAADPSKFVALKTAPVVDSFLPATLTDVLITEVQETVAVGKIIGTINATTDLVHSRAYFDKDQFDKTFKVGKKVRGRIICNFPTSDESTLGFSVLDNLLKLDGRTPDDINASAKLLSSTVPSAKVIHVEPGLGIYLDLSDNRFAFAHISRLADKRVDTISQSSGPYMVGSEHQVRVLDFNPLDNLYMVSLQDSVIKQPFLRIEDVPVGSVIKGKIEKVLIGPAGVKGLIVDLAEGITGYVSEMQLSDVALQHAEKKFREGGSVKTRVLSTDISKRQIQLTLKKTLVNSDSEIWKAFDDIVVGDSSLGTLVKVDSNGALVQFYGSVKGFLPVSEMSEAYIKDAREHFKIGQVLTTTAISVDPDQERVTLSCRENSSLGQDAGIPSSSPEPGSVVSGVVFEKSEDDVQLRLEGSDVIARITLDHVADGSLRKRQSALSKIRVGQKLEDVLVLDVQDKRRLVVLCNKASLVKAAKEGTLLRGFEQLKVGARLTGFVSNITSNGIFVSYASRITGLLTPRNLPPEDATKEDFGVKKLQTLTATVATVDYKGATPRFWLTLNERSSEPAAKTPDQPDLALTRTLSGAVDSSLTTESDLVVNKVTKARIVSVKDTQLNVELAKNVQGRVDVSEVFDSWDYIKDRKKPLRHFSTTQVLDVKVLGAHDTRNHRFLPLSHRKGNNTVYELTAKPTAVRSEEVPVDYSHLQVGSSWVAFVNNIGHDCLWASISPSVRGRVKAVDVSDDLSLASDMANNFPLGSALRVRVVAVDATKGRLDLTARTGELSTNLTIKDISRGMILPGRVTKVTDRQVLVQLSDSLVGAVDLIDLADDYAQADLATHQKNEVVRVCVIRVDEANKRINLSLRPSRVLSSGLTVLDPEIKDVNQLHVNDIYSGFIRNVDDKGVFVTLGHGITAFIRIAHLSDLYLKEWKDSFQRDQLVRGKIISVDRSSGHVQMSLKESIMKSDYTPPVAFSDLKVGDVVTGKVAKVQDFGVFVVVNNSENVRGLCHRSEIAAQRVEDATKLFAEGDVVKAKVLQIDASKRRVNFGMKASYFTDLEEDDVEDEDEVMKSDGDDSLPDAEGRVTVRDEEMDDVDELDDDSEDEEENESDYSEAEALVLGEQIEAPEEPPGQGLKLGGFDWHGISTDTSSMKRSSAVTDVEEDNTGEKRKKRKKRAEIQIDRTGDLDANGPQSVDDYERLLMGAPDSSLLWLQYMAFHLELGDIDQARQIGERALKSIGLGQDAEKMNVWVAMLNLENAYGDEESVEATFSRGCEYNDVQEIHTRLTSIYIQSGKHDKADDLFQRMLKKFTQDPKVWVNYGTFLFDTKGDAEKGRDVLSRALTVLPKFTYLDVTLKFAQLEFKSTAGLPERGRTIFEGLISSYPKRIDLYNVLLDLEMKLDDKEQIRGLFERIFSGKLKPKQAKYFFKRWLAFEEKEGDERKIEDVKARAATWIRAAGSE